MTLNPFENVGLDVNMDFIALYGLIACYYISYLLMAVLIMQVT
jgi:hypothetical protein